MKRAWVSLLALSILTVVLWSVPIGESASKPPVPKATVTFGQRQSQTHTAAVSTPPLVPFIKVGMLNMKGCPCVSVFQMQRALKAAHFRKGKSTGVYGKPTAKEVAAFQKHVHIKPVSGRYGLKTHRALSKYYDGAGRARLIVVAKNRLYQARARGTVVITTHAHVVGGNTLAYSEGSSRGRIPDYPSLPPATDCSGYVTWVFHSLGLPDPSGFGYRVIGWTGTLALHGIVVPASQARIGDLVFYGGGYPFGHVAIYIGNGLVSSHGGPGINVLPIGYRPVSQVRRYF